MDDLLTLLFIIISVGGFISKQAKKKARKEAREPKREKNPYVESRQQPVKRPIKPQSVKPFISSLENRTAQETPLEGLEFENRSMVGSLAYAEQAYFDQDPGTEGHDHEACETSREKDAATAIPVLAGEEQKEIGDLLTFSSEDIFRSIIMSEILGTPRAIKGNIR